MNRPKPLLPSQDRYEETSEEEWRELEESHNRYIKYGQLTRFEVVFIWVCVLTGFALIGAAFAWYS